MKCYAIEYMRPDGRKKTRIFDLPDEYREEYESMTAADCHFAGEELMSGMVSITIENDILDVDIELCANESSLVEEAHLKLLRRGLWRDPRNLSEV